MSSDETRKYIDPVEGITLDGTHFKGGGYGFVGELLPIGDRVIDHGVRCRVEPHLVLHPGGHLVRPAYRLSEPFAPDDQQRA